MNHLYFSLNLFNSCMNLLNFKNEIYLKMKTVNIIYSEGFFHEPPLFQP